MDENGTTSCGRVRETGSSHTSLTYMTPYSIWCKLVGWCGDRKPHTVDFMQSESVCGSNPPLSLVKSFPSTNGSSKNTPKVPLLMLSNHIK